MLIIHHRRNTVDLISSTNRKYGVEIDIRSSDNELIIHHDPYQKGALLKDWLKHYRHMGLILNIKEEGLEDRCMELMDIFCIDNYFFLDQSFPFLMKTIGAGNNRCAVRISEYEPIELVMNLKGHCKWVWVDYFSKFPLSNVELKQLKQVGYNICIVSPELQCHSDSIVVQLRKYLADQKLTIDAVCTKKPHLWETKI